MITERRAAKAFGAKTARSCDSCLLRRARWYCAADDAFLCQGCDSSVHSANQLARRHERVRLGTASLSSSSRMGGTELPSSTTTQFVDNSAAPAWHGGFTRKARTPRISKKILLRSQARNNYCEDNKVLKLNLALDDDLIDHDLVPEIGNDLGGSPNENYNEEDEEQFLCRVPVFDLFESEMVGDEMAVMLHMEDDVLQDGSFDMPSDVDLAEFAADVENLLSNDNDEGTEDDFARDMKDLGVLLECKEEGRHEEDGGIGVRFERRNQGVVKEEGLMGEGALDCHVEIGFDMTNGGNDVDWDLDCYNENHGQSLRIEGEEEEEEEKKTRTVMNVHVEGKAATMKKKRKMLLRLNYEGVMAAWASQGSPWTTGDQPDFNPDEGWPNSIMGTTSHSLKYHRPFAEAIGLRARVRGDDGGREARVSRYREKRRTRMFSKKIRYQVRKLNAEKRPRMKGRFIKRMSFI
ncbi:zinc finger protein CONSTANS-LIKE 16-like [Rhodamnia argentea]|uniref:Zinc finger protein CONSTANS-LIKE 16-like n=1 Tax=Rhodamnia argentea TaxID=178133 RepID=A0A8B8PGE9_9MYRT|nr:zinc finger protein CONSTANS-LIKE 16-like [Rhodamnia argentea]